MTTTLKNKDIVNGYRCPKCKARFSSSAELDDHLLAHPFCLSTALHLLKAIDFLPQWIFKNKNIYHSD